MNSALIFAGGTGVRMNSKGLPKQFLEVQGKPIIIHTLEHFELCEDIDEIVVVCIENYIPLMKKLLVRYDINKVVDVIPGGVTGFDSRMIGLKYLINKTIDANGDIVLIHDGVRPLITSELISKNIEAVKKFGNAITTAPVSETIITVENEEAQGSIDRSKCKYARAPQSFRLNEIYKAYCKAEQDSRTDIIDSASIMEYCGYKLHVIDGPVENIKITTPSDFYLFKTLLNLKESNQIWGM